MNTTTTAVPMSNKLDEDYENVLYIFTYIRISYFI